MKDECERERVRNCKQMTIDIEREKVRDKKRHKEREMRMRVILDKEVTITENRE